jgi:hypothetical protein
MAGNIRKRGGLVNEALAARVAAGEETAFSGLKFVLRM